MNKKRIIFSSVCVILLVALIGGSLAWFYINEEVTVSYGNSIFCEAGDSLEISLVENGSPTKWSSSIDYSVGEFTTVDISGNGEKLYRPMEIDENRQPVNLIPAVSNMESTNSYDYVEMVLAFRSVSEMNVYLSEESFISPAPEAENTKPNIYGNFSRNYIAGAMRVAVIDYETNELLMLWAPNSKYQLIDNDDGTYAFKAEGTSETTYKYFGENENGELVQKVISAEDYASKKFVVDSTDATKGYSGDSPVLVSLKPEAEGAHAQRTVRIRIWFEGTDREAHQALAGGNVNIQLKFIGISKKTAEEEQAAIDNITFNPDSGTITGMQNGMVFTTDGRTWTQYVSGSTNLPALRSGESIFIKYPETATHFETTCRKFTKN